MCLVAWLKCLVDVWCMRMSHTLDRRRVGRYQLPCGPSPPPCLLRSLFLRVKGSMFLSTSAWSFLIMEFHGGIAPCHVWSYVLPKPNPQNDTNYRKNPQTNHKNRVKLKPRVVPETLGGGLWTISVSGVPQRGPRDARSRKSDEKFVHSSLLPCFLGTPKSYIFGIFRFLCCFLGDVFRKRFLEASGHHF